MAAVEFRDGFGIDVSCFRIDKRPLLKVSLEQTLCTNKKRRAIVAVPVRVAAWHDFSAKNQNLGLRVLWERGVDGIEQDIALVLLARFEKAIELKLQVFVLVELELHVPRSLLIH